MRVERYYSSNPSFNNVAANDISISNGSILRYIKQTGVNLNTTGDVISITGLPNAILIDSLVIANWSATPNALLALTLRDASAGAGNSLVGAVAGLNSVITATSLCLAASPLAATLGAQRLITTNALYVNVGVANGSPLTGDVYLFYRFLP